MLTEEGEDNTAASSERRERAQSLENVTEPDVSPLNTSYDPSPLRVPVSDDE